MEIEEYIRSSKSIALDTNIFIYAFNQKGSKGKTAKVILEKIKTQGPRVYISVLAFEEFLIRIYKQKLEKVIDYYEDFLTAGGLITVVDINREISRKAAFLRAKYKTLRAPDAFHLASALESKASIFITADRRIPKRVEGLIVKSF